jgi:hypothetical protein
MRRSAADRCGDRRRGQVGLLGGQAALLDRPRGHVAGGEDTLDADHGIVAVNGDEALVIARQPGKSRPRQPRRRYDGVGEH